MCQLDFRGCMSVNNPDVIVEISDVFNCWKTVLHIEFWAKGRENSSEPVKNSPTFPVKTCTAPTFLKQQNLFSCTETQSWFKGLQVRSSRLGCVNLLDYGAKNILTFINYLPSTQDSSLHPSKMDAFSVFIMHSVRNCKEKYVLKWRQFVCTDN